MSKRTINHSEADGAEPWREQLAVLLPSLIEGALEPDRKRELIEILTSSEDARRYYLRYLQIHAELSEQWGGSGLVPSPSPLHRDDSLSSRPDIAPSNQPLSRGFAWASFAIAASIISLLCLLLATEGGRLVSRPSRQGNSDEKVPKGSLKSDETLPAVSSTHGQGEIPALNKTPDNQPSGTDPDDSTTPTATQMIAGQEIDAQGWDDIAVVVRSQNVDVPTLRVGQRLGPGTIAFDQGVLQLEFMCGAKMVLVGPAKLQLESAKCARLLAGDAKMRVLPRGRGFVLNTSDMAVVDLGTEFDLQFDNHGKPEVSVIEGSVELSMLGRDGNTLTSSNIVESQRMSIDGNGVGQILSFESKSKDELKLEFPLAMPPGTSEAYGQLIKRHLPLIYWRFSKGGTTTVTNEMSDRWIARLVDESPDVSGIEVENNVLKCSRTDQNRYLTSNDSIQGLDRKAFSVEVWFNPDDIEHTHLVGFAPRNHEDPMAYLSVMEIVTDTFLIHQPASLRALYRDPPDKKVDRGWNVFTPGLVTPGQWHHAVFVKGPNTLRLYLNGELQREVMYDPPLARDVSNEFQVVMGQLTTTYAQRQFSGSIDEFALYERQLTDSEIAEHYQVGLSTSNQ